LLVATVVARSSFSAFPSLTVIIDLVDENDVSTSVPLPRPPLPSSDLSPTSVPPPSLFPATEPASNSLRSVYSKLGRSPPPSPLRVRFTPPGNRLWLAHPRLPPHTLRRRHHTLSPLDVHPRLTHRKHPTVLGSSTPPARRRDIVATLQPPPTEPLPSHSRPPAGQRRPPSPSAPPIIPRAIFQPPGSLLRPLWPSANQATMAKPPGSSISTHLIDLTTAPAPLPTRNSTNLTGRLPAGHGSAPVRAGPHRSNSQPSPLQPPSHLHRPHLPARHPTTLHPVQRTTHHRAARPPITSRRNRCGTAVHAPNGLRSRWIPPPTQSLGQRWIPPPTPSLYPPPPHTPPPGLPLPRVVIDLTRTVYRKVFLSPGTKGFPPDRKRFIHRPRLSNSHTFSRASGYVAYSSSARALGVITHNPEISPGRTP